MTDGFSFPLSRDDFFALFRHLKGMEERLDRTLLTVLARMENEAFRHLTIEEYERFRETGELPAPLGGDGYRSTGDV